MDGSWLDYGAFGLLALVLGAVGVYLRGYLNREQDRAEKRDEAVREERIGLNDKFTELVERDVAAKQELGRTMADLCVQVEGGQAGTVRALKAVTARLERNEQRAADRHEQVVLSGEVHRGDDVRDATAPRDERRTLVDHPVPDGAGVVVAGVARTDEAAE